MRKIERITAGSRAGTSPPTLVPDLCVEGPLERALASPPAASIFLEILELEIGTSVEWAPANGDRALFIERGGLGVDGQRVPAGGAILVESGARLRVEAKRVSRLLHFGPREAGAAVDPTRVRKAPTPPQVHLVGPRGRFEAIEPGRETRFFADASCSGCSIWLLFTARSFAYESPVHSHSQDELIHVVRGEIALGSLRAGPGTTLFIAAGQPYRFRSAADGFAFLNYRQAGSVMTLRPGGERIIESGLATGMTPVAAEGFV